MRFSVINLGCKVNRVESDKIAARMLCAGEAVDVAQAELVLVNTCTVTGEADKKTRKTVRHVLRENPDCAVIVTGCASQIAADFYAGLSDRITVVPKHDVLAYISQHVDDGAPEEASAVRYGAGFNTRVGIKVQDGCDNACTYCIVHVARGKAVSEPYEQIVRECVAYARCGVKELILTGINLGSYKYAQDGRTYRLHHLLEKLLAETAPFDDHGGPCRFRLSSIEPNDVTPEVIELMVRSRGRICRHMHLPLQSGSEKVLREMARPYDADSYRILAERLREKIPQLALSTDIIVGFPGETEEDFQQTLAMARACGFSKIHVFPYSRREGTSAAARPDQVPPEVKMERARELRQLSDELRQADRAARAGATEMAVVEENGLAMTESYYEISCDHGLRAGDIVAIEL